ncbi:MAG TPA: hypothetical protein VLE02_01585 [Nitrosarchaeum sp.]|nr:hypothetical protein [Nitrosarchaeum sp.]
MTVFIYEKCGTFRISNEEIYDNPFCKPPSVFAKIDGDISCEILFEMLKKECKNIITSLAYPLCFQCKTKDLKNALDIICA